MTVNSETAFASFAWTGVETNFTPGWIAEQADHVKVYSRDDLTMVPILLTRDVHYGVNFGTDLSVQVTPIALPAPPKTILILRDTPALQPTNFQNLSGYDAATHQNRLDECALRDGELKYGLARTMRFPIGEDGGELPALPARIGKFAYFDASGVLAPGPTDLSNIQAGTPIRYAAADNGGGGIDYTAVPDLPVPFYVDQLVVQVDFPTANVGVAGGDNRLRLQSPTGPLAYYPIRKADGTLNLATADIFGRHLLVLDAVRGFWKLLSTPRTALNSGMNGFALYETPGIYTFLFPPGVDRVWGISIGAGAAGGGSATSIWGAAGGSGGTVEGWITRAECNGSITIVVRTGAPAPGIGNAADNSSIGGGNTEIGPYLIGAGGLNGQPSQTGSNAGGDGGIGGVGSGTNVKNFQPGGTGQASSSVLRYDARSMQKPGLVNAIVSNNGNGADVTMDILHEIVLPAGYFKHVGESVRMKSWGYLANAVANKTVSLTFGASSITLGPLPNTNTTWRAELDFIHVGSNSQKYAGWITFGAGADTFSVNGTASENEANQIVMRVNGQSSTAVANNVVATMTQIEAVKKAYDPTTEQPYTFVAGDMPLGGAAYMGGFGGNNGQGGKIHGGGGAPGNSAFPGGAGGNGAAMLRW